MKIETLLRDPQKLLETDWKEMDALKEKYPYSNLVSFLLARKHYLENRDIKNKNLNTAIFQNMNPGSTLSYVLNGINQEIKKSYKPIDKEKETKKPSIIKDLDFKEEVKHPVKEKKDLKIKDKDDFIKSDYTKWLISLNHNISKEKPKREVKVKEPSKKSQSAGPELKHEILSESLAQLYAMQGLKDEAIDMYEKLSLKNPKKSTYFAEIIRKLKKE